MEAIGHSSRVTELSKCKEFETASGIRDLSAFVNATREAFDDQVSQEAIMREGSGRCDVRRWVADTWTWT